MADCLDSDTRVTGTGSTIRTRTGLVITGHDISVAEYGNVLRFPPHGRYGAWRKILFASEMLNEVD